MILARMVGKNLASPSSIHFAEKSSKCDGLLFGDFYYIFGKIFSDERSSMKRDMDLVRQILIRATEHEDGYVYENPDIAGYTKDQIDHHIYLMCQAGLVEASDSSTMDGASPTALLISVTWAGHDFIDAARSNTIWSSVKDKAKSVGGALTFDLMKELLVTTARSQLDL